MFNTLSFSQQVNECVCSVSVSGLCNSECFMLLPHRVRMNNLNLFILQVSGSWYIISISSNQRLVTTLTNVLLSISFKDIYTPTGIPNLYNVFHHFKVWVHLLVVTLFPLYLHHILHHSSPSLIMLDNCFTDMDYVEMSLSDCWLTAAAFMMSTVTVRELCFFSAELWWREWRYHYHSHFCNVPHNRCSKRQTWHDPANWLFWLHGCKEWWRFSTSHTAK